MHPTDSGAKEQLANLELWRAAGIPPSCTGHASILVATEHA